jgi:hypothetical protein
VGVIGPYGTHWEVPKWILEISAPSPYPRPNWGGLEEGSQIVLLGHPDRARRGVKYWSVNGAGAVFHYKVHTEYSPVR